MVFAITDFKNDVLTFSGFGDLHIPEHELRELVEDAQMLVNTNTLNGTLVTNDKKTLKMTHITKSLEMDNYGVVMGELEILPTPSGDKLKEELIKNNYTNFNVEFVLSEDKDELVSLNVVTKQ